MPVWTLDELRDAAVKLKRFELLQAIDPDVQQAVEGIRHIEGSNTDVDDLDSWSESSDEAESDEDRDASEDGMDSHQEDMEVDEVEIGGMEETKNASEHKTNGSEEEIDDLVEVIEDERGDRNSVIEYRYKICGGVARACFMQRHESFVRYVTKMQEAVKTLTTDQVIAAITDKDAPVRVHRLLHFVPVSMGLPYQCRLATIKVASPAIEQFLAEQGNQLTDNKQMQIESIARYVPELRALLGYSIETRAKNLLETGCKINAFKLNDMPRERGAKVFEITVPSESASFIMTTNAKIDKFDRNKALIGLPDPAYTNLTSIDGFVWLPKVADGSNLAVLFQTTVSLKHPVKALGYKRILEALGHWDAVVESSKTGASGAESAAVLVFAVPKWTENIYRAQRIASDPMLNEVSPVSDIVGIGDLTARKLARLNIRTVGDLHAINTNEDLGGIRDVDCQAIRDIWGVGSKAAKANWKLVARAKSMLKNHESGVTALPTGSEEEQVLRRIPQYVWGV